MHISSAWHKYLWLPLTQEVQDQMPYLRQMTHKVATACHCTLIIVCITIKSTQKICVSWSLSSYMVSIQLEKNLHCIQWSIAVTCTVYYTCHCVLLSPHDIIWYHIWYTCAVWSWSVFLVHCHLLPWLQFSVFCPCNVFIVSLFLYPSFGLYPPFVF